METPAARFGLPPFTYQTLVAELARYPQIERVVVFGSRAKGTHRPGSDIDLALLGPHLTPDDEAQLYGWLDDLDLPWFFDVVRYDHLTDAPDLRAHIRRVGQVLAARPTEATGA